jgi:predicted DNA-binding transcriptional regulator AlpA
MMAAIDRHGTGYAPRLLRREWAAAYLGISPASLDRYVAAGKIPEAKLLQGVKVWDRHDLDATADDLPYLSQAAAEPDTSWD